MDVKCISLFILQGTGTHIRDTLPGKSLVVSVESSF